MSSRIEVSFSIADLANLDETPEELDDQALYDEEGINTPQSGGANTKGSTAQGRRQDGNIAVAPEDSLEDDAYAPNDATFPARVHVKITRDGRPGALVIQAVAEAGDLMIENVWLFPQAELADAKTAEVDWQRRNLYTGPPFENLDEDLKLLFERYLEERGINMGMALFIPDYIDHKEQREYLRWLSGMLPHLCTISGRDTYSGLQASNPLSNDLILTSESAKDSRIRWTLYSNLLLHKNI